jgi:hypothetical protein
VVLGADFGADVAVPGCFVEGDGCVDGGVVAGEVVAGGVWFEVGATGCALGIKATSSIHAEPWMRLPKSPLGLRLMQTRTCREASPVAVQGMLTSVQGCVPCKSGVSAEELCAFSIHSSRKRTP